MSGQHVIARLDAMEATTNARFDALVATTNARFDAVDAQLDIMGWAIMATLAIVGALAGSGLFMGIQLWRRAEALATAAVPAQSEPIRAALRCLTYVRFSRLPPRTMVRTGAGPI